MKNSEQLTDTLKELIELLDEFEVNWAHYFRVALKKAEGDHREGAKAVLQAFGGIGSFNEFQLPHNAPVTTKGFSISKKRIKCNQLSDQVYQIATAVIADSGVNK